MQLMFPVEIKATQWLKSLCLVVLFPLHFGVWVRPCFFSIWREKTRHWSFAWRTNCTTPSMGCSLLCLKSGKGVCSHCHSISSSLCAFSSAAWIRLGSRFAGLVNIRPWLFALSCHLGRKLLFLLISVPQAERRRMVCAGAVGSTAVPLPCAREVSRGTYRLSR